MPLTLLALTQTQPFVWQAVLARPWHLLVGFADDFAFVFAAEFFALVGFVFAADLELSFLVFALALVDSDFFFFVAVFFFASLSEALDLVVLLFAFFAVAAVSLARPGPAVNPSGAKARSRAAR